MDALAEMPSACEVLAHLAGTGDEPRFLASYPTASDGPLKDTAFLYDNAAAAIALVGCGEIRKARPLAEAILLAAERDRFWHDGRLRNAYASGTFANGPAKLSGWWDAKQGQWLEDRYQVGSDNGNMAWAMLALLTVEQATRDRRFGDGADRLGHWVAAQADPRGAGGFPGGTFGHEPAPETLRWKSTEHNTDLAAAFGLLAARSSDPQAAARWRDLAEQAHRFVSAMWREDCRCFAVGTGEDGVTLNPTPALDAQIWPLTALPGALDKWRAGLAAAEQRYAAKGGVAYGNARETLWTEGTGQLALLLGLMGDDERARAMNAVIARQQAPSGGYFATDAGSLPTGFMLDTDPAQPRLYFHLPHLGATAWAALAERRFNPFTGRQSLP